MRLDETARGRLRLRQAVAGRPRHGRQPDPPSRSAMANAPTTTPSTRRHRRKRNRPHAVRPHRHTQPKQRHSNPDAPDAAFAAEADRHPVFELPRARLTVHVIKTREVASSVSWRSPTVAGTASNSPAPGSSGSFAGWSTCDDPDVAVGSRRPISERTPIGRTVGERAPSRTRPRRTGHPRLIADGVTSRLSAPMLVTSSGPSAVSAAAISSATGAPVTAALPSGHVRTAVNLATRTVNSSYEVPTEASVTCTSGDRYDRRLASL